MSPNYYLGRDDLMPARSNDTGEASLPAPYVVLVYPTPVITKKGGVAIGGAERYLLELADLAHEEGCHVALIQFGAFDEAFTFREINVISLGWTPSLYRRHPRRSLTKVLRHFDIANTVVIFGSESAVMRLRDFRTILIQHGIGFDFPPAGRTLGWFSNLKGTRLAQLLVRMEALKAARSVERIVCVDYVYPTWLKTFHPVIKPTLETIPNFSRLPGTDARERGRSFKKVLFARRFVDRRGAQIMAEAAARLLRESPTIEFTFAGSGPLQSSMEEKFLGEPRVRFTSYDIRESLNVHQQHDIAVIPSLASEGTSFSLLEAMAAGCAVVTTPVAGLMNVVLDGYNGLVCAASGSSVADAILRLHTDEMLAEVLAKRAEQTVRDSFSYAKWRNSWRAILKESLKI